MSETDHPTDSDFDIESSLDQLEQLVQEMESGELTLEQSLTAFEKGIALTRKCQDTLKRAEQRIAKLADDTYSES